MSMPLPSGWPIAPGESAPCGRVKCSASRMSVPWIEGPRHARQDADAADALALRALRGGLEQIQPGGYLTFAQDPAFAVDTGDSDGPAAAVVSH